MTTQSETGGLVVAAIDGGSWSSAFGRSLLAMTLVDAHGERRLLREGCGPLFKDAPSGGIADARNACVQRFLDVPQPEWLLMLDTDMVFDSDLPERMIASATEAGVPVLSALCFALKTIGRGPLGVPRSAIIPTIYDWVSIPGPKGVERGFLPRSSYERDSVVECDGVGAAALLMHREALRTVIGRLGKHETGPFDRITVPGINGEGGPRIFSEDLSFCIRAGGAGVRLAVDTSIKTAHDKGGIWLDEDAFDATAAKGQS